MHIYFETSNLLIRQYTMQDTQELYEIMSNPRVHAFTKDKEHPWDRERTEEYIRFLWIKILLHWIVFMEP